MADNVPSPEEAGGIQKVFCPECGLEVTPLDSYHLTFTNERLHYPVCYQVRFIREE